MSTIVLFGFNVICIYGQSDADDVDMDDLDATTYGQSDADDVDTDDLDATTRNNHAMVISENTPLATFHISLVSRHSCCSNWPAS